MRDGTVRPRNATRYRHWLATILGLAAALAMAVPLVTGGAGDVGAPGAERPAAGALAVAAVHFNLPRMQPLLTKGNTGSSNANSTGSFYVSGNEVVQPNGQQFVPYGVIVFCLAMRTVTCSTKPTTAKPVSDLQKIQAAAQDWHANVVRIQLAPEDFFLTTGAVNQTVLADLTQEVHLANSLGMVAIITDQEEYFHQPPLPTSQATTFWHVVAGDFKSTVGVFFDLYNEPHLALARSTTLATYWTYWRTGGYVKPYTASGTYQFVGMQGLVTTIRATGAQNVIVAEGLHWDKDLAGIPTYGLSGTNIAYGMEPDLVGGDRTPTQWAANWGNLSETVPILMEAFQDWPGASSCNTQTPTLLPQLLSYLQSHHLGMEAWALEPGVLMIGDNPATPTTYAGVTAQVCTLTLHLADLTTNTIGPGQLIQNFFLANAHRALTG